MAPPRDGLICVELVERPPALVAHLDRFAVEIALDAHLFEVAIRGVVDALVDIAVEVEHLEQRPRVKWLDGASMAAHDVDARHAIGAESQGVQKARRCGLRWNLLRPAVLHFDFLAAWELAVELRRRAADFVRFVFAARERGFDDAAIGVGGEVDGSGVEGLVAEDLRARQGIVASWPTLSRAAGGRHPRFRTRPTPATPRPTSATLNSVHFTSVCRSKRYATSCAIAPGGDRLTFAALCGNLHSTRHTMNAGAPGVPAQRREVFHCRSDAGVFCSRWERASQLRH